MTEALRIDDARVQKMLDQADKAGGNMRPAWRKVAQYMRVRTDSMFRKLRRGGSHRGVTWRGFAPQYTRKTDGVTVPAWGGVKKLRGRGKVKGRKRPSGQRLRANDSIMQDTGTLRSRAALTITMRKNEIRMGPSGVDYAARQDSMRKFLFFEIPKDADQITQICAQHIAESLEDS